MPPVLTIKLIEPVKVIVVSIEKAISTFRLIFYMIAFSRYFGTFIMSSSDFSFFCWS